MFQKETEKIQKMLEEQDYVADPSILMSVYLAKTLHKPLLIEGPAGVGKTEIAKVMAKALNTDLIRLQCYEGLDANMALYEWNYQRQLLHIKLDEKSEKTLEEKENSIFSETFLLKRPLLQALMHPQPPVLLIDELDRSDEEFESFLLEILSEWQITIPEIGTIRASDPPYVILTSNRTRELSDAVRRRCFYLWLDYPEFDKELAIVRSKVPGIDESLGQQICLFMEMIREEKLEKVPGVAETLDWARALVALHQDHLDQEMIEATLGIVFKDKGDVEFVKQSLSGFMERVGLQMKELPSRKQASANAA
ncbi:MAG: MoxR family ATPase [SAR324 cluster bacterium]|nr:ATPase [Deltaproteobacteria bacterium]MAE00188.1 ATPase [Pseudomonadota bacterium]MDP6091807.1 MoxR family ATPase [SAR324 cluster bacterium]MBI12278.1 ATPase [Deltaproteobacteria bacterium]MBP43606.1 ATPase [Deltaproteobacteria bacterium]